MEGVLVEGTVKEARAGTIRILEPFQRRNRVPEAKTLGMKGFRGSNTSIKYSLNTTVSPPYMFFNTEPATYKELLSSFFYCS